MGIGFDGEFGSQETSQITRRRRPGTLRESKVTKGGIAAEPRYTALMKMSDSVGSLV